MWSNVKYPESKTDKEIKTRHVANIISLCRKNMEHNYFQESSNQKTMQYIPQRQLHKNLCLYISWSVYIYVGKAETTFNLRLNNHVNMWKIWKNVDTTP